MIGAGPRMVAGVPRAGALNQALSLLSAVGGSAEMKRLVAELKAAAEENRALLDAVTAKLKALEGLEARERALSKREAAFDDRVARFRKHTADVIDAASDLRPVFDALAKLGQGLKGET